MLSQRKGGEEPNFSCSNLIIEERGKGSHIARQILYGWNPSFFLSSSPLNDTASFM